MGEKPTDEIIVALPRKIWNGIRGCLIALGDRKAYLWENDAEGISLELEAALQKTPNWRGPEKETQQMIFKYKHFTGKTHIHVAFFTGQDEKHLHMAGRFILLPPEWTAFKNQKAADEDQIIYEESEDNI